jgi:hypothetical protein
MAAGDQYAGRQDSISIGGSTANEFQDVSEPFALETADAERRSDSGWKRDVPTSKRKTISGKIVLRDGDTVIGTIINSMISGTDLAVVITRADGQTESGDVLFTKCDKAAPLRGALTYDVEAISQGTWSTTGGS